MANIRKMLDLSTAHLPESLGTGGLAHQGGVIADERDHGFIMWVPDEVATYNADYAVPPEVQVIQIYARALDCDYVLFDADAERDPNLPTWEWS